MRPAAASALASAVVFAIAACAGDTGGAARNIVLADSAGIRIVTVTGLDVEDLPEWTLDTDPVVEIGSADGAVGHDLYRPRAAARLPGGEIIIANTGSNEIREFDSSGRFIRALGRKGSGPGEFENLSWAGWLEGDTILGYDPPNRRLTVFAPDGAVARTVTLPLPNTSSFPEITDNLADGSVLAYPGFDRVFIRGGRRDTLAFMLYPPDGSRADTLGSYPGPERFFHIAPDMAMSMFVLFGRNAFGAARGNEIVLGSSDALVLDVFDGGGTLRRRIRVVLPPLPITRTEAEAQRDKVMVDVPEQLRGAYRTMLDESPRYETYPAFTALLLDDAGLIWVRLPAPAGVPADWLILSGTGTPAARVRVDAGLEIEEAGSEYILTRVTDADGVERIRLHSLTRG